METIHSQIKRIRDEKRKHKLVIFVGAGVSRNSGVCSWSELVTEIAEKIKYNKCNDCGIKAAICDSCGNKVDFCNDSCHLKHNFSNDEFLLIPQLYYDSLDNEHKEYYSFVHEKFSNIGHPNIIDDIIISLSPECIITTNYDHLIEDVNNPNVSKYTVIKKDKELLYKKGDQYIIKMHGDIDDIENIVLKEDDYLNYSQNHTLMETYIKSLLIDKTFLFIGYSLNDNNLKMIMSYIEYFVKENEVTSRTPHYLALSEISNKGKNRKYWKNKGIELIDLEKISEEMISHVDCKLLTNQTAKRLFTFLSYINNDSLEYTSNRAKQLEEKLLQASQTLKDFRFIEYKILLGLCHFKHLGMIKTPYLAFYDESEYELFKKITKGKTIRRLFIKSRIYGAELRGVKKNESYLFPEANVEADLSEELFELSIRNKYKDIIDILRKKRLPNEKAYYYSLVFYTNNLKEILGDVEKQLNKRSMCNSSFCYEWAIFEFNRLSYKILTFDQERDFEKFNMFIDNASIMYGDVYKSIKNIMDKKADIQEMNDLLLKHEESYMKKETVSKIGGTVYAELPIIQQIMYDYYLFYKKNFLMLDWFNNVEHVATPYVKAILCTYYPDRYQYKKNGLFGGTMVESYPISILDIDIIVKHIKYKNLKEWATYYKVEKIKVDSKYDISIIFEDFCKSMRAYWNINLPQQFETFCYLLSLVELDNFQFERAVKGVLELVESSEGDDIQILISCIPSIFMVIDAHYDEKSDSLYKLLDELIDVRIIHAVTTNRNAYPRLIKKLTIYSDEKIYTKCVETIENNNSDCYMLVYYYSSILLKYDWDKWTKYLNSNLNYLSLDAVFDFIENETIKYNSKVKKYFNNKLKELYVNDEKNGLVKSYPDYMTIIVENLIILFLAGRIKGKSAIDFLKDYVNVNDYIKFIFEPEIFDYSKVDTANYMWCNFLNNDTFRKQLLKHKSDFWTKDKEKRILLGFGTSFEHRVVYKYLIQ